MKKIRIKLYNKFLAFLGVGAFAGSCIAMYGTPEAVYHVDGRVSDDVGNPIAGISVRQYQSPGPNADGTVIYDGWESREIARTASDGTFSFKGTVISFGGDKDEFIFRDIDGTENGGEFEPQVAVVEMKRVKKGRGAWNAGTYEAEDLVEIVMKRVPEQDQEADKAE